MQSVVKSERVDLSATFILFEKPREFIITSRDFEILRLLLLEINLSGEFAFTFSALWIGRGEERWFSIVGESNGFGSLVQSAIKHGNTLCDIFSFKENEFVRSEPGKGKKFASLILFVWNRYRFCLYTWYNKYEISSESEVISLKKIWTAILSYEIICVYIAKCPISSIHFIARNNLITLVANNTFTEQTK